MSYIIIAKILTPVTETTKFNRICRQTLGNIFILGVMILILFYNTKIYTLSNEVAYSAPIFFNFHCMAWCSGGGCITPSQCNFTSTLLRK